MKDIPNNGCTLAQETLTLKPSAFGSKLELDDKFFKKMMTGTGIMESILNFGQDKQLKDMKKTDGPPSPLTPPLSLPPCRGQRQGHLSSVQIEKNNLVIFSFDRRSATLGCDPTPLSHPPLCTPIRDRNLVWNPILGR